MQTELFEINTPETIGVTPRYVLQHNAISRSAHNFSPTAKKLTAIAILPPILSSLSSAFTFTEFCAALGVPKGVETFTIFKEAVKECMESVIEVEGPPNKKGKKPWVMFHWFQLAEFNPDTGVCTMTFDKKLAKFLKEQKWLYSKIPLTDLGRLQSRYALRIYECTHTAKDRKRLSMARYTHPNPLPDVIRNRSVKAGGLQPPALMMSRAMSKRGKAGRACAPPPSRTAALNRGCAGSLSLHCLS